MKSPSEKRAQEPAERANWREWRRFRALELSREGWKQKDIAAALGVAKSAVSQWLKGVREEGESALLSRRASGRPPRMSPAQVAAHLPALLESGAESFGFRGQVWTAQRVAQVLKRTLGVAYSERHMRRLLRQAGLSVQKPEKRAVQRDQAAIEAWRQQRWPQIKKGQHEKGGPSSL